MIEGGVFWGRNPATGIAASETDLLHHLDSCGVTRAIVSDYKSLFYDLREGHRELLAALGKSRRFILAAAYHPFGQDPAESRLYYKQLFQKGFRVFSVLLTPRYYDISLESRVLEQAVRNAAEAGYVIQFGLRSAQELALVSRHFAFLKTPVLIRWMQGRGYTAVPEVLQAATAHPDFLFDLGGMTGIGVIRELVRKAGAERFFYASNFPEAFPDCARYLLEAAGLSSAERRQIEGDNLARLFEKNPRKARISAPKLKADYQAMARIPKVDTHWHTEGWNLMEPGKDSKTLLSEMKKFNIRKAVFSSIRALNGEMERGNRDLFRWASKVPEIHALVVVDPLRPEDSLKEMQRYRHHSKCLGIKTIQDLYGLKLDDPAYDPMLKGALMMGLPVMAHIPGLLAAARKHQELTFICAHATYARVQSMFGQRNIYFDLATSHQDAAESRLGDFIQQAGADRILFASDAPLMSPAWTLGKLASVPFTSAMRTAIFWENAHHAFPRLGSSR